MKSLVTLAMLFLCAVLTLCLRTPGEAQRNVRNFDPASTTPEFTPNIPAQQATIQQASATPEFTPNNPAQRATIQQASATPEFTPNVPNDPAASVTGFLGKPRGSRIIIDGIMVNAMLRNPLAVSAIDGRGLLANRLNLIEIRGVALQKGTRYRFEGYESGEFGGIPSWLQPEAQQPFQFRPFFVVTRVIEAKPDH